MIVGDIQRNETEVLRVSAAEFKGRKYVDVRIYFEGDDGEWKPTKKGVTVSPDKLQAFIELLQKASASLE
jgi:hypothetical protein